jgi:signal transduction histidine kinase
LVGNAVEHGKAGAVTLRLDGREGDVVATVHNQGEAIAPALLPTIFEPFRHGEGSARGLGLGLHIVREIVRSHGGAVDVRSGAEGTTFRVSLPRRAPSVTVPSELRRDSPTAQL